MTDPIPGDRSGASRPLVIAIGNRFRGDDGVGGAVLDALAAHPKAAALDLLELDGEPTRLIDAWDGRDSVVVVNAVRLDDGTPGTVVELDDREAHDPRHRRPVVGRGVEPCCRPRRGRPAGRRARSPAPAAGRGGGGGRGTPAEGPGLSAPVAGAVEVAAAAVLRRI